MAVVVLDTDVISGHIKKDLPWRLNSKLVGHQLITTFVSAGEAMGCPARVAREWGEILAYAGKRGRPRPVNDSWIAACCLVHDVPLATLNVGHFSDFVDYEGLRLIAEPLP